MPPPLRIAGISALLYTVNGGEINVQPSMVQLLKIWQNRRIFISILIATGFRARWRRLHYGLSRGRSILLRFIWVITMVNLVCKSFVTLQTLLREQCVRVNNTCCIDVACLCLQSSIFQFKLDVLYEQLSLRSAQACLQIRRVKLNSWDRSDFYFKMAAVPGTSFVWHYLTMSYE